ncbi:MAG: cytochrome-c peroxidase, partial [Saprospiraceae bacterium]|nr:cytochrome-c peroxidase [Saprospiraceae bacterium]
MHKISFILFISLLVILWSFRDPDPVNEAELGKLLFFDPILSKDSTLSCASCHKPEFAFADHVAISPGVNGSIGRRNAPSVMNMSARSVLFYDGRAKDLEDQVHFPIEDPKEMNASMDEIIIRLINNKRYAGYFKSIYNEAPDIHNLSKALAAYEAGLETSDTEFDAWMNDLPNTMSVSAIRGRELFMSKKAKCFDCHFSPDFTGDEFKNIGLFDEFKYKDKGRYEVSGNKDDIGKFKVPGLRNVAVTGPYMHDGSFAN